MIHQLKFFLNFLILQGKMNPALPLLIFGLTALVGGAICFILPETKDHNLKQTIQDGEEFMKQNIYKSAPWYVQFSGH